MHDDCFTALGDEYRRKLLVGLLDENPQRDEVQTSTDGGSGAMELEHRRAVEMYHHHLPKLVHYGFVRWNKDMHEVTRGPRFNQIRPLLEFVAGHTEG
jgi:hypothetical protein